MQTVDARKEFNYLFKVYNRGVIAGKHRSRLIDYMKNTFNINYCITNDKQLKE